MILDIKSMTIDLFETCQENGIKKTNHPWNIMSNMQYYIDHEIAI
jgi:hypothetical protein